MPPLPHGQRVPEGIDVRDAHMMCRFLRGAWQASCFKRRKRAVETTRTTALYETLVEWCGGVEEHVENERM